MKSLSKTPFLLAALCAAALPALSQGATQASVSATVRLTPLPGAKHLPTGAMEQTLVVLHNRANAMGIASPSIRADGSDRIVIQMPGAPRKTKAEQRKYVSSIIQSSRLEFVWLKDVRAVAGAGSRKARYLYESASSLRDIRTNKVLTPTQVRAKVLYADPKCIIVTGADLKHNSAIVDIQTGRGVLTRMEFNDKGTRQFADFTRKHIGSLLAIVLNGKIQSAPRIMAAITDGTAIVEGSATTVKEAQELADLLNAGALPAVLTIESVE